MIEHLFKIFLIILTTFINVTICSLVSYTCFDKLIQFNVEKHFSFIVALMLIVLTQAYLIFYSSIRKYYKKI
jgi:hypothetical protein